MEEDKRQTFLKQLNKLDPAKAASFVDELIHIGASASNHFFSDISIWLTEALGTKKATSLMKKFLHFNDAPFQLKQVFSEDVDNDEFREISEEEMSEIVQAGGSTLQWIVKYDFEGSFYPVPVIAPDGGAISATAPAQLNATLKVGDQVSWIKSKRTPLAW